MKNMLRNMFYFVSTLLIFTGCNSCNKGVDDTQDTIQDSSPITWTECGHEMGDHPCDFTLVDQDGNEWSLYDHYGEIIVLDFSTQWCYYCQVAGAEAQALQDSYIDKEVVYVSLLIEDNQGNTPPADGVIQTWADTYGITAPVLGGSRDMLDSTIEGGWQVTGWPTFYFIDREMVIHTSMKGYSSVNLLTVLDQMLVNELLEE